MSVKSFDPAEASVAFQELESAELESVELAETPALDGLSAWDIPGMKRIVDDLFAPRVWMYWRDFGLAIVLAWGGVVACLAFREIPWLAAAALLISAFSFYRGLAFIHELAHLSPRRFALFEAVWNVLCGFALFLPTFTYRDPHRDHHSKETFGTERDPRYLPLAYGKRIGLILPIAIFVVAPAALALRFLVLGPLSLLLRGKFRDVVVKRMSALEMNIDYERQWPEGAGRRGMLLQELGCFAFWAGAVALAQAGWLPWAFFAVMYALMVCVFSFNHYRALGAHRYATADGKVSFPEQLMDSITVSSPGLVDRLLAPVGLSYHSLHHLFPALPYHALEAAHTRLVERLPAEHPYRATLRPSIFAAVAELWGECGRNETLRS